MTKAIIFDSVDQEIIQNNSSTYNVNHIPGYRAFNLLPQSHAKILFKLYQRNSYRQYTGKLKLRVYRNGYYSKLWQLFFEDTDDMSVYNDRLMWLSGFCTGLNEGVKVHEINI